METEAIEVNLWVLKCLDDAAPGKLFVLSGVAIVLESRENVFPLCGGEKRGGCGVIMDKEVSGDGVDDS